MKKRRVVGVLLVLLVMAFSLTSWFCDKKKDAVMISNKSNLKSRIVSFDSTMINTFYAKYPKLILYKKQVVALYQNHEYNFVWFDKKGRKETADVIYNKINNLPEEGVEVVVPYKENLDALFQTEGTKTKILTPNYFCLITISSTSIKHFKALTTVRQMS